MVTIRYAILIKTINTPPKNLPKIICALDTGFEIMRSMEPFSSIFGMKLEAEKIDKNNPPPKSGATTNNFKPFTISSAILNGSLPFAFTIPLKSSNGTSANNNPNIIITNVDIAKKVMNIFRKELLEL